MLETEFPRCLRTIADFHSLHCTNRHHGLREACIELVEYRLADTGRHIIHEAGDDTAGTVLLIAQLEDTLICRLTAGRGRHVDTGELRNLRIDSDPKL